MHQSHIPRSLQALGCGCDGASSSHGQGLATLWTALPIESLLLLQDSGGSLQEGIRCGTLVLSDSQHIRVGVHRNLELQKKGQWVRQWERPVTGSGPHMQCNSAREGYLNVPQDVEGWSAAGLDES